MEQYNSYLYVNLSVLAQNYRTITQSLPAGVQVIPVLKGNAYGLGLVELAHFFDKAPNVCMLAVAQLHEAIQLAEAGIRTPILLLGALPELCVEDAVAYGFTITLGRLGLAKRLSQASEKLQKPAAVHIKLDTGLHRIGVFPGAELDALLAELAACFPALHVGGVYSQFADAETYQSALARTQYQRFLAGVAQIEQAGIRPGCRHLCNSAASEWFNDARLDAVRLGRRLYMDSQDHPTGKIQEAASWRTEITGLKQLHAGDTLGYGAKTVLHRDTVVASLPIGYGDGLSLIAVKRGVPAMLHGKQAPFLGTCMDQSFLDVTGRPCAIGDEVTLFGYDSQGRLLSSQEVARFADDEGCGLTSFLTPRVGRVYLR